MKQKNSALPATKEDITRLEKKFATKKEVKEFVHEALEKQRKHYEAIVQALKDEMLNKFIEVLGELQAIREENAVGAYQIRDVREELKSHDKRITKLESL